MRSAAWGLLVFSVLGFALLPTAQAKGALFFETVLVEGTVDDFANGALDIATVYVSEVYPYDPDRNEGYDRIVVRIEPRNLNDMQQCQVPVPQVGYVPVCGVRYDVRFTAAGQDHHAYAVLGIPGSKACCPVQASNTLAATDGSSLRMSLDRIALGLLPGTTVETLYVTSSLISNGQSQAGDREPGDNQNVPYDLAGLDDVFADPYTLEGTYDFFRMEIVDGTHRNSVGGQPVEFALKVTPTAGVRDDTIRFLFDIPEGWSVTPDRGTTGIEPRGLLTGLSEGMVGELGLTIAANGIVEDGDVATIVVHAFSSSQGYKPVPLTVRVTDPTIEDPDYAFLFRDVSSLRRGETSTIRFQVLDALGQARTGLPIDVVFSKDGRRITAVPAVADGEGYRVDYAFPSAGAWTVDARVADVQPSPHGMITVQVQDGNSVPSVGLLLASAAFALVALLKARFPARP